MANTSNHGWEIPDVGGDKNVWGQILNDFFDDELDQQIKLEGTFSNRPDAGSDTVKYYHATDRRIVYYNDGSSWEAVYGLGTDSNPVPGTSHFESVSTSQIINASVIGLTNRTDIGVFGPTTKTSHNYTQTTLVNGQTHTFDPKESVVFLRVVDSGAQAGVSLYKDAGAEEVFIIWDPANTFSTTQGNDGTVNVYYDDLNYLLTNQTGNEIDVSIHQFA